MTDKPIASDDVVSEVNDLLNKKDFGSGLKLAREKSSMSLTEVAENLHISVDIIKALENSQIDALPALTFTQGYIRSYARLLGVSADEIISDYVSMVPDLKQVLNPNSVLPAQKCCNDKVVKLISFGFLILAIFVLVYWLVNTDFKMALERASNVAEFNSPGFIESDSSDSSATHSSAKLHQAEDLQSNNTINSMPVEDRNLSADINSDDVKSNNEEGENLNPDSEKTDSSKPESSPVVTNELVNGNIAKDKLNNVDTLMLSALDDSWCEIQDSTGKRLYYQLLHKGEDIKLSGIAPFMVFLGNAPKVRVEINNKIVDFDNLINKNSHIASLKITTDASVVKLSNQ